MNRETREERTTGKTEIKKRREKSTKERKIAKNRRSTLDNHGPGMTPYRN